MCPASVVLVNCPPAPRLFLPSWSLSGASLLFAESHFKIATASFTQPLSWFLFW